MHRLPLALAVVAALACAHPPPAPPEEPVPTLRLPRDVRPLRYDLRLTVAPERAGFSGEVAIEVELARPARAIWLHARELTVREASVETGARRVAATLVQVTDEGVARLTPASEIPAGRATLRAEFQGAWNERLRGLYRVRAGGEAYAYTDLEAIEARRVFPGFDEPAFKAPFDVALTVPQRDTAVSNGPARGEEPAGGGMKRVRFETTPPLPTYLVFAAVGPFDVVVPPPLPPSEVRPRPLPLRMIGPRGSGPRLAVALEATRELLPLVERWFGLPFPYPKLDQVVAPDYAHGGMENAGAILYGEQHLGFEPGTSPEEKRRDIGRLVAHELAHQWFGDFVTLEWWDDVWLNESFATFLEWKAVAAWRPQGAQDERVAARIDEVMAIDALATARAVRQPLRRTEDIGSQFDRLSYVKGGAVLRGFERLLGEERFRQGIRDYLAAHAHGSATTAGVLASLSRAAGREVAPPFLSLLDQPGAPLVEARTACEAPGPRIELEVSRYRPLGSRAGPGSGYGVPVCARYEAAGALGSTCTLVTGGRGTLPLPACPRWIMPAAGGTLYYRWLMPGPDLQRLRDLGFAHLTAPERISYAAALRAGARAGRLPYAEVLAALAPLTRDGVPAVATAALPALTEAVEHLVPEPVQARARAAAADVLRPRLRELGLEPAAGESVEQRRLRLDLLSFLVQVARDAEVTRALARLGVAYAAVPEERFRPGAVAPELAGLALDAAVMTGDAALFEALQRRLAREEDPELRARILAALGSARDPDLSARALSLAGDPDLRVAERARTLFEQAAHPETLPAAWKTVRARWDPLVEALPRTDAARLPDVAKGLCDRERARDVRRFLEPRVDKVPGARRRLEETVERIELCAALREAQGASAAAWLTR